LLKSRGMIIDMDDTDVRKYLSNYGYYRISAYFNLFRKYDSEKKIRLDDFQEGTTFSETIELYDFDSKLRNHILRGVEKIEISLRTAVTYILSTKTDNSFVHYDEKIFHSNFLEENGQRHNYGKWLYKIETQIEGSSDEFIKHYNKKYNNFPRIPIWMFTEILTIGDLSVFFQGLDNELKKKIADWFPQFHYKSLIRFFHRLSIVRNICAHHGRLWNRKIPIEGTLKQPGWELLDKDKLFFTVVVMVNMLKSRDILDNWYDILTKIIAPKLEVKKYRRQMGFPDNWQEHQLLPKFEVKK
jgi:abortive infection bacteriophage resistance protein